MRKACYVKFRLIGANCEEFLSEAFNRGIKIYDSVNEKGVYYAKTTPYNYVALSKLKRSFYIQMKVVEKHGICFKLNKYKYRYGVLFGIAAFSLIVFLCSSIVWDIKITGNKKIPSDSVLSFLAENGIYPGASRKSVNTTLTELKAILNYKDLAWISIEQEGSRVNVKITERIDDLYSGLPVSIPCNLVAERDGKLIYAEIYEGKMMYELGSGVKAGDVVVSGFVSDSEGNQTVHHANGKVIAEFEQEVSFYQSFTSTEKIKTKDIYYKDYIKLFGFTFPNSKSDYKDGYSYTSESYAVSFLGIKMPWNKIRITGTRTENIEVTRSVNDVKRLLEQELNNYEQNFLNNYVITKRDINYERDDNGIKIICKYVLQGNILSQKEIFLRD